MTPTPDAPPYQIEFYDSGKLDQLSQDSQVFAIVRHGQHSQLQIGQPFVIELALPPQGEDKIEVWRSAEELVSGEHEQVHFKHGEHFLFGGLCLDESDFSDLSAATFSAYQQIHDALEATGFPAILRMWNYFPEINVEADELERYRAFCLGRHKAIDEWHFTEELLPAASAIGTQSEGLMIYFLAAKEPGTQIENPRQISAFHYPKQYGPLSPSFSRATLKKWGQKQQLFISGTASIVGHETKHENDLLAQLEETLANIRTVIQQAHKLHQTDCMELADLDALRIYIRHPQDSNPILEQIRQAIGTNNCQLIPVQGDVCRSDLLLEIEGLYSEK